MLFKATFFSTFTIVVIIAIGGCAVVTCAEIDEGEEPALATAHDKQGEGGETETVLRVQYDGGVIRGLYVAQRGGGGHGGGPSPVATRRLVCEDLCSAGLGGTPCGWSCEAALPAELVTMTEAKKSNKFSATKILFGNKKTSTSLTFNMTSSYITKSPRTDVCPTLCKNGLGKPLCDCPTSSSPFSSGILPESAWSDICTSFCQNQYQVPGCPVCEHQGSVMTNFAMKSENPPSDVWVQWCQYQCVKGEGGAACKCDLAPLSLLVI